MSGTRTRVKICGITNLEDAKAAVDYGADAIGVIRVPESPRYVSDEKLATAILGVAAPFVVSVAVCHKPTEVKNQGLFRAVQFYDTTVEQNSAWYGEFNLIYACRMRDENSLEELGKALNEMRFVGGYSPVSAVVLDTYHKDKLGGSGETFNWELAVEAKRRFNKPIILAGGLTPENVGDAVAKVRPYAVDVSSGVEAEPGRKDHVKLKAFIDAVRDADRRLA